MEIAVSLIILMILGGSFLWLLPLIMIALSNRTSGTEKLAWILAVLFISWFAWIFYLLLAPLKRENSIR